MNADQFAQLLQAITEGNRNIANQVQAAIEKVNQPSSYTQQSAQQVSNPNITLLSNFDAFDPAKEKFIQYQSRFENFLKLKKVSKDKAVSAQLFLNSIGPSSYDLLCSLAAPRNIYELSYDELTELLSNHYPKSNELIEQHKFLSRLQSSTESISDYVAALRKFTSSCSFSCPSCDESVADLFLRAQFIRGIKDPTIREQLLQIKDLTFAQAVDKSLALEASKIDNQTISNSSPNSTSTAAQPSSTINRISAQSHNHPRSQNRSSSRSRIQSTKQQGHKNRSQSNSRTKSNTRRSHIDYASLGLDGLCLRCSRNNHKTQDCRIEHSRLHCDSCNKPGHVAKVCITTRLTTSKNQHTSVNSIYPESSDPVYGIGKVDDDHVGKLVCDIFDTDATDSSKFFTTVLIEGKPQTFEVDSGAARTLLPRHLYDQFNLAPNALLPPDIRFRSYTGEIFDPCGYANVKVQYNSTTSTEKLYVVDDKFSPILGRVWIRHLNISLQESNSSIMHSSAVNALQSTPDELVQQIENDFAPIFEQSIGVLPDKVCSLQLRPNSKPVVLKPRPLPFAIRESVELELHKLTTAGVITKIENSDWASPLVVVPKPDGSLRLCVDYKTTVNPQLCDSNHPIPRIDETLHKLRGAQYYCKLDLFKAYMHIPMDNDSAIIQAISTHLGIYRVNRLGQGIKTAPSIFHSVLDQLLGNLTGVTSYFDDIVVYGTTLEECYNHLISCLKALQRNNLHLNRSKCVFFSKKITYLGYVIEYNKISKSPAKVSSILEAPRPKNIDDIRRFLGLITYYSKFIPQASTLTYPIRQLLLKNKKFFWSSECEAAFLRLKQEIASDRVLTPYDPALPLQLACDASPYGIAAVLSHVMNGEERPIAFISRSLTAAESQYSQLDREALAIVFAIGKFFQYLYGRHFELITDNRPLIRIFHPSNVPPMTAGRLLRYSIFLRGFDYTIRHRSAEAHKNVDYLSRSACPAEETGIETTLAIEADQIEFDIIRQISSLQITSESLARETASDPTIQPLLQQLQDGTNDLKYTLNQGVIFRNDRAYIPASLQPYILKELHSTHSGIVRMKRLARRYCYWPKIDSDIEKLVRSCSACAVNQRMPAQIRTHSWEEPTVNFERVHMDYAGPFQGYYIFILIDAKSKWPEVRLSRSAPTSASTIDFLQDIFSFHGFPSLLVSDNATIFTSTEFNTYCRTCGIAQRFIAPGHPATNGQAERFVQTLKHALKTCLEASDVPIPKLVRNILLRYRATPLNSGKSPAELYLQRQLRIQLDVLRPLNLPHSAPKSPVKRNFIVGERVLARFNDKWQPGKITTRLGSLHYNVLLDNGFHTKKHVNQLVRSNLPTPSPTLPPTAAVDPTPPMRKQVSFDIAVPVPVPEVLEPIPDAVPNEAPGANDAVPDEPPPPVPEVPPELRRSTRSCRPPDRLNL